MIKNLKKKITHTSNNNTDSTSTANQDAKLDALSKLYSKELSKSNQLLSDREILESNLLNKEKLLVDQSKQLAVMQKMLNSYKKNVSTENSLFEREYNLWLDEKSKYENKINALQSQLTDSSTIEKDTKEEEEVEIKNSFLGFVENLQNSLIHSTSSMLNSEKNPDDSTVADNDDNKSEISFSNEHGSDIHSTSSSLVDESLEIQNDEDNELPEPNNNSVLINDLKSDLKDASQKLAELNNVYNKMTSDHNTMLSDNDHSHTFNNSEISDSNNFDISVDDIDYDYDDNENNDVLRNAIINVDYQKLKTLEMELDDHSTDDDNNSVLAITHRLSKNRDSFALASTDNASILHKFGDLNEELNYSKELNFSLLLFVNQLVKDVEHLQHNNNVEDNQALLDAKTNNALTVVKRFDDGIVNHEINEHLQTVKNFLESHNYDNINKFPHPLRKKASRLTITATENLDNQEEANSKIKKSASAKSLNDSHHHNSFLPTRRLTKFFKKNNSVNSEVSNSNSIANSSRIVSSSSTASISSSSTKTNTNINTDVTTPTSSPMKTTKNVNTVHYNSSDSPSTSALLNSSNVITSHTDGVDMIENSPSPLKNKSINKRYSSHHPSITRTLSNKVHERSSNKSLSNRISRVLSNNIHSNFSLDKHHDNNDVITTSEAENGSTKKNTEQKGKTIIGLTKNISEINSAVPDIVPYSSSSNATVTGSLSVDAVHKAKSVETMNTFSSIPSVMAKNDSVSESRKNHINDEVDCSVPSKIISDSNGKSRTFNNDPVVPIKHKKAVITKVEFIDHEENEKDLEQQTLDLHDEISDILEVDEEQEEPEEVAARPAGRIIVVNEDPLNAEDISNLAAGSRGSVVIADPAEYVNNAANANQSIDSLIPDDSPDGKISNGEPAIDKNAENDHDTSNTNLHSSSSDIHSQNSTIFSKSNDVEEIQHSLHDEDGHASQEVDSGNQDKCTADSYLDIELLNHSETLSDDIKSNDTVNNKVMDNTSVIESIYEMIMKETGSINKGISQSENNNSVIMEGKNKNEKADSYEIMRNILNDHHQLVNNKNLLSNIHSYLLLNGQHDADYLQNYPILKMLLSKHVSHESNESLINSEFKNINELID